MLETALQLPHTGAVALQAVVSEVTVHMSSLTDGLDVGDSSGGKTPAAGFEGM
jgi:hypothetical protein